MPSLLTSPRDGQSQPRMQKFIRPFCYEGGGEGHLNFVIPQLDHKTCLLIQQGITKIYKTFKIFRGPPPGKKCHFPWRNFLQF